MCLETILNRKPKGKLECPECRWVPVPFQPSNGSAFISLVCKVWNFALLAESAIFSVQADLVGWEKSVGGLFFELAKHPLEVIFTMIMHLLIEYIELC